jgi:ABC-type phosphate transport system substrate-binding protein
MSAFKQKLARLGATAGVLVASTAAIMAVGGAEASSALAGTPCSGTSISGEGSSLQGKSQAIWTAGTSPKGFNHNAAGCTAVGAPTVTYTASGSSAGLEAWGVNSGTLKTAGDSFVATDDAPNAAQIGEMRTGLETTGKATDVTIVPVTQTSIAVAVHLPTGCTLTQLTNANLEEIFRGTLKNWSEVTNESGCAASSPITRVVRLDGSGTSYQLKHYLSTIDPSGKFCTEALGEKTWTQLQSETKESGVLPNTTWPDCASKNLSPIVTSTKTGGGALVTKLNETVGGIGYAADPDMESGKGTGTVVLELQDEEVGGAPSAYAKPTAGTKLANCNNVPYNMPEGVTTWAEAGTKHNLNWSQVYGSNKNVAGGKYSICTLTWDIAATKSKEVFGESRATTTHDFLKYVTTTTGGQADLTENWYRPLPTVASSNVQEAAVKAVEQIEN